MKKKREKAKKEESPLPKFVLDHIEDTRINGLLDTTPERIDVNAPRALVQTHAEGHLAGIQWMLRQPLYAAAPKMLTVLKLAEALCKDLGWVEDDDTGIQERTACAIRAAIEEAGG